LISIGTFVLNGCGQPADTNLPQGANSASNASPSEAAVTLSAGQPSAIKIEPVGTYSFPIEKEAVGNISYDKVTDPSTKALVTNVTEDDIPLMQVGQPVKAMVLAYSGHVFDGKISELGAASGIQAVIAISPAKNGPESNSGFRDQLVICS
jgi:hypothetical protein